MIDDEECYCGTKPSSYAAHRRRGETPCKASKRAWANQQKIQRANMRNGNYSHRPFNTEIK